MTFHHKLPTFVRDFIKQEKADVVHTYGLLGWTLPYCAFHYSRGLNVASFRTTFTGIKLYRFLGRLDPRKGSDKLLSAFPKIKAKIRAALLIVVGAGNSIEHFKKMIPKEFSDPVHFEGRAPMDLIPRYYASCDVYVSPATGGEVFGTVLAEAMATGKTVIASNIPGYNEVITDVLNELLFDVNAPDDNTDKVVQVLGNSQLRKTLATKG